MKDGYHYLNNAHAFKRLNKPVAFPDAKLGIGDGEDLTPQESRIKYPQIMKKPVMPDIDHASYELTQIDGFSNPLSQKDFPSEFYFGDPLGEI